MFIAKDRSLSIKLDPNAEDGLVVYGHAGDDPTFASGRRSNTINSGADGHAAAARKVAAEHVYRTAEGEPHAKVLRYQPKGFSQQHWDGCSWQNGKPESFKFPYRLPEMLKAVHDTVLVVEDEKDADRLTELGFVATTGPEGAGKWVPELAQWFAGKTVFIIADKDEPGRKHAENVAASISSVVDTVRIVEMPHGKDISEWLDGGGDTAVLIELCERAPLWKPKSPREAQPQSGEEPVQRGPGLTLIEGLHLARRRPGAAGPMLDPER